MPSGDRPRRLAVVLGTGTGVGKTWVTAELLRALADHGVVAAARKPVQSFAPEDADRTDAHLLAAASPAGEKPQDVCPAHRWYEMALAPPMAAAALGRPPFSLEDLVAELAWPPGVEVGLVEMVGGPRSPIAADGDSAELATMLSPDVAVLVADAGLGAINSVRLSAEVLITGCATVVVLLNRYQGTDTHRRNRDWLLRDGFVVTTSTADVAGRLTHRPA